MQAEWREMQEIHHQFFEEVAGADLGSQSFLFFFCVEMGWGIMLAKVQMPKGNFGGMKMNEKMWKYFQLNLLIYESTIKW